jgi:hypothetical protein
VPKESNIVVAEKNPTPIISLSNGKTLLSPKTLASIYMTEFAEERTKVDDDGAKGQISSNFGYSNSIQCN